MHYGQTKYGIDQQKSQIETMPKWQCNRGATELQKHNWAFKSIVVAEGAEPKQHWFSSTREKTPQQDEERGRK